MTNVEKLKQMIMEAAQDIPSIIKTMDEASEWNSVKEVVANVKTLAELVKKLAEIAVVAKEVLDGSTEEAVTAVAEVINEQIDIPWVPESMEQQMFELGVGMVINLLKDFDKDKILSKFK